MKRLAEALDEARRSRSRIGKEEAIGRALGAIAGGGGEGGEEALAVATRFAAGRTLPVGEACASREVICPRQTRGPIRGDCQQDAGRTADPNRRNRSQAHDLLSDGGGIFFSG